MSTITGSLKRKNMNEPIAPKLTKVQQGIIDLMRADYELGAYKIGLLEESGLRCRLQKGGVGKGGETIKVAPKVFKTMLGLGCFTVSGGDYRYTKYTLNLTLFPEVATTSGPAAQQ